MPREAGRIDVGRPRALRVPTPRAGWTAGSYETRLLQRGLDAASKDSQEPTRPGISPQENFTAWVPG